MKAAVDQLVGVVLLGRTGWLAEAGSIVMVAETGGALQGGHQFRICRVQTLQLRCIVGLAPGGLEPV